MLEQGLIHVIYLYYTKYFKIIFIFLEPIWLFCFGSLFLIGFILFYFKKYLCIYLLFLAALRHTGSFVAAWALHCSARASLYLWRAGFSVVVARGLSCTTAGMWDLSSPTTD